MGGWVVEEPPFSGLGLGRNVDRVVREYKVDGVGLPHGARAVGDRAPTAPSTGGPCSTATGPPVVVLPGPLARHRARVALDAEGDRLTCGCGGGRRRRRRRPAGGAGAGRGVHRVGLATTVGEWRGQPCQVQDERGDELLVEYTGGRVADRRALGFDRVERGV